MKETSILIKPASSSCNMTCTYCFYDDVSDCRTVKSYGLISETTWKTLVDESFNSKENFDRVNFSFQGGEPLVAGYRFFKSFVDYTQSTKGTVEVTYSVQTNGTKINEKFCKLFKEYDFLLGVSIDGFKENHNLNRFLRDGGSFDDVMAGVNLLKAYEIPFNILTVLTKNLAKYPEKLFDFYLQNNFDFVQIIPCLPSFGRSAEEDLYACTPELYESFYKTFYDIWLKNFENGKYISENLIDNVITLLMGGRPSRCGMLGKCETQCIVEADGGIYPCDFYVLDEFKLGNINDESFDSVMGSDNKDKFVNHENGLPDFCRGCNYINICGGNCKRMRSTFLGEDHCGYQAFLNEVIPTLNRVNSSINNYQ